MDSGLRIPHPWIPDSLSGWIPDCKILFWITDFISWIPDSKAVNSGLHRPKLLGFRFRITLHGTNKLKAKSGMICVCTYNNENICMMKNIQVSPALHIASKATSGS